jgi:hypothetical protein
VTARDATPGPAADAIPGLAANTAAPAEVLLRLLKLEYDWGIVARLTWRRSVPDEVAEAMLNHPNRRVRAALADSAHADPELRARLLDGPASDAILVAVGPTPFRSRAAPLPDWAYERLLTHDNLNVRYETLLSPSVPDHVLLPLATHTDRWFRLAACRRVWDELTDEVRASLLEDPDPEVRAEASLHVMHEDEERTAQLVESGATGWRLGDVLESGKLGRGLAERLLAEGTHLRQLVRNPTFPADLAAGLADHPDPVVRLAVSARPELTEEERAAIDWKVAPEDRLDTLGWVWRARADEEVCAGAPGRRTPGCGAAPPCAPACRTTAWNSSPPTRTSPYGCCSPSGIRRRRRSCCSTCICTARTGPSAC